MNHASSASSELHSHATPAEASAAAANAITARLVNNRPNNQRVTKSKSTSMPARWLTFEPRSLVIADRFIACKTPLTSRYNYHFQNADRLSKEQPFSVESLIRSVSEEGFEIGLWIDLTQTDRYYDCAAVIRHGIEYRKLPVEGHGVTPSKSQLNRFDMFCNQFIQNSSKLIVVHCTHGCNRTGYMIAAHLCRFMGYDVSEAIKEFEKCRPPGIYRQEYKRSLLQQFRCTSSAARSIADEPTSNDGGRAVPTAQHRGRGTRWGPPISVPHESSPRRPAYSSHEPNDWYQSMTHASRFCVPTSAGRGRLARQTRWNPPGWHPTSLGRAVRREAPRPRFDSPHSLRFDAQFGASVYNPYYISGDRFQALRPMNEPVVEPHPTCDSRFSSTAYSYHQPDHHARINWRAPDHPL